MFDLTGKVALVTGASGGIGAAIARALHAQGAAVALSGRRAAELEALAAELKGKGQANVLVASADLADPAAALALVESVEKALGSLDILVNNAGFTKDMLALRMGDADWQGVLDVDLSAPFRLSRAALRGMMKKRWGRIISIGSIVGASGNAGQANYAAAKAGLVGMTKALAQEVAPRNVTCNVVAPGYVETAMTDVLGDAIKARMIERIPTGRIGRPEDIAAAVVYLASVEAGWVTGQTIHVNGGMAMY
jgi:3-oxoacyl-[acyl-carrier protein] reductase